MGVEDEGYLSTTARQAANAGWTLITIFMVILGLVVLGSIFVLIFHAPWYYTPFIIIGLIWALS